MDSSLSGVELSPEELPCLPTNIVTTKAVLSTHAPVPASDENEPQNAEKCNRNNLLNTLIPTNNDDDKMRRKINLGRDVLAPPKMDSSTGFLASVKATAARVTESPTHTIMTASASTVLSEHEEYVRQLTADWNAMPTEFSYKRRKRDKRKFKAEFIELKDNLKNPSWKDNLRELDALVEELQEKQKQWNSPEMIMKIMMTKTKKKKKEEEGRKDNNWYDKMLTCPQMTSGRNKKLRRTIEGWEEVDIEDDEAEAMVERKQLRRKDVFPYNTWKWDDLSSSDETEAREARVVAAAIKMLEKPLDSDDEDDEPPMHSLFSDDETIAEDPPLRTKEDKAREKAQKQERELIDKEHRAREELRPLLHPFFRGDNQFADHILHTGALPVEVLKQSQFFPVSSDVRKAKTALYKRMYEEKMAVRAKKEKAKHNRSAKKQRRFEARREKRSAYAASLATNAWDFPKEALAGYDEVIAKARIIPVMTIGNTKKNPVKYKKSCAEIDTTLLLAPGESELEGDNQLLPILPLASEYARHPNWTFQVWDEEMAWTEYDTLPGRFEAISKIIKDDDWNDQFVKGSKLDQELMRTIVVPAWNAMTYEEKTTVLGGQRVDPACFYSDDGGANCSYVSGSPKMVDPFDIEESDWIPWSHSSESDYASIKSAGSGQEEIIEPDSLRSARSTSSTDKAVFNQREMLVSEFLEVAMPLSTGRASSDARTSLSTEKETFNNTALDGPLGLVRSFMKGEKARLEEEEINESNSLKSAIFASDTDKAKFNEGEMHVLPSIAEAIFPREDSFRNDVEIARSSSIHRKRRFKEGRTKESDSWQSGTILSNIQMASFNQEERDASQMESETPSSPEDSLASSAAFEIETTMPRSELESLVNVVSHSDSEESSDNSNPDLDLMMLFQRVGAFVSGEEAPDSPDPSSSREAELIFNLLRKEAVVRHWFPERTFSYDNVAWKTRVSIFDPNNKEAVNPAIFPNNAKKILKDYYFEYSDPERMDLSIPGRNNTFQERPDMQVNWIGIADEYRLGLNGRQRLTKPGWAKNYDLIRAQQPDPLIYIKDRLEFDQVGYFSEVLPKQLVFPEATEETKNNDNVDWIWQKHCMDQRIGLHPCAQRPDPNATIGDEEYSGLIGDNLPPEDQRVDTNRSIRYKRSSGDATDFFNLYGEPPDASTNMRTEISSRAPSLKMSDKSDAPADVGAHMLKELKKLEMPVPETAALGRPPPQKYIQSHGTPAAVLMKIYQEEYDEFCKECPEPTSIRFEREVFLEAPVLPEKKAKQELDDYLTQLNDEQRVDFSKEVVDAFDELVAIGPYDIPGSSESPVELINDFTSSVGSVKREFDFKPKLKVNELDTKKTSKDMPMASYESVEERLYMPIASHRSDAGSSGTSVISGTLSRRSERYRLRDVSHEKPSPRALPPMNKESTFLPAASGANLNRAIDASKERILRKMKERGESAEKQASIAATMDMFKHSEPSVPELEPVPESPILSCNKKAKLEEAQPTRTPMTPAKARAIIDYLIERAHTMKEDELKENIIHFFGERFFAYAMTRLDLLPVDVFEEEANAYIQQRFETHTLIEGAQEAKTREDEADKMKSAEPMSKNEAQFHFEATMTPAKAGALLGWAKRTQPSLYIKHMLAPGLLEYCDSEIHTAPITVTQEEGSKFIVWNRRLRQLAHDLMELRSATQVNDIRTEENKSEPKFDDSTLISLAKDRALVERLFKNGTDLEVMKLRCKAELDRIMHNKLGPPVQPIGGEAITVSDLISKRAMEICRPRRGQKAHRKGAYNIFRLLMEETPRSNSEGVGLVPPKVDDLADGSEFSSTFENDPKMSPELAVQLIVWILDVKPDCDPELVLGKHAIRCASQYHGPELRLLEDDEAFPLFKKYSWAQQLRTGRIKAQNKCSEQRPQKKDDACSDFLLHRSGSETSVLEKSPDMESLPLSESISDTIRLCLKPSQVREFVEYLKSVYGHYNFKNKAFDRMIKGYIQLPDDVPTKDFPFRGEGLALFKQMLMAQLINQGKRQLAFEEGRVAYAYGASTDPDIRKERGEDIEDDEEEEEFANPYDDIYDGVARLFGSMSSIPRFDSPRGSCSFRSSFESFSGDPSNNERSNVQFQVPESVNRRQHKGLFVRKRLSHTFDPPPKDASPDSGCLHIRRNPSYGSQHESGKKDDGSSSPPVSASQSGFGLVISLPKHEQNENDPQGLTQPRRHGAKHSLPAPASDRSTSPVPPSEDSDNPWRPPLEGRVSQRLNTTNPLSSHAGSRTPPPASYVSWPSGASLQNSMDWGTRSSASMAFSQFQENRRNYRLEEANTSSFFPLHESNSIDRDVEAEAENSRRDEEDHELSDMEAYEAWYNAKHGVSVEELEEGRRYFAEEQKIDEMSDDPEMLEKILGVLAKIDTKVAEVQAEVGEETKEEEERDASFRGDGPGMEDNDSAHLFLTALDLKKEFKKTLLNMVEIEHLDAEEIEMLFQKIDERDEPSEYEWVDENGEPREESVMEDNSDEEDDIDQNYHVQEHQERMQLNFEHCEYEGALARIEAWRDAHEEHADPDFPEREREADEARRTEDKKLEVIVKTWTASKAPLTVPNRERGRHLKAKALRKKEKVSHGNTHNSQGQYSREQQDLAKRMEAPLLDNQTPHGSIPPRKAPQRVSFQVTVEDESSEAEQRAIVAEMFIAQKEELTRLKSFESLSRDSIKSDIGVPSLRPSLRSPSDDASKKALLREKKSAGSLSLKSRKLEVSAQSPTPSTRSISRGDLGMPSRKMMKAKKPSSDVAGPSIPSHEMFSPSPSMSPTGPVPGPSDILQRMSSGSASTKTGSARKSIKARLGLQRKDLNNGAPSPTPSLRSVSYDLPRRASKKLTKKRKPDAENIRPSTPSNQSFSIIPPTARSECAPRSISLGQHVASLFKRKDKEEVDDAEKGGLSMIQNMRSMKFNKRKD